MSLRESTDILARRAYPDLKPSGFCSRHYSGAYECTVCFPDWPALVDEHVRLHAVTRAERDRLRSAIEEFLLWDPRRPGHGAATDHLRAALSHESDAS